MSIRSQTCDNGAIRRPAAFERAALGSQSDGTSSLASQQDAVNADDRDPVSVVPETDTDCAFCTSIGRLLSCCQDRMNPRSCPHCTELVQHLTRKDERHRDEIAALHDKVRELEEETPEQRSNRLSAEKNTKIDRLKSEVEKINKEDESLKAENKELEKKLKMLDADIKKLQPPAEFTVKQKKTKGKKK